MNRPPRAGGRSIRTRLLVALMLITLLTLGLSTLLSALMDIKLFRDHMARDLEVLAAVVGENCVSALVFDDPETAERHLATLEREYQIRSATLLDARGETFAQWGRGPHRSRGARRGLADHGAESAPGDQLPHRCSTAVPRGAW